MKVMDKRNSIPRFCLLAISYLIAASLILPPGTVWARSVSENSIDSTTLSTGTEMRKTDSELETDALAGFFQVIGERARVEAMQIIAEGKDLTPESLLDALGRNLESLKASRTSISAETGELKFETTIGGKIAVITMDSDYISVESSRSLSRWGKRGLDYLVLPIRVAIEGSPATSNILIYTEKKIPKDVLDKAGKYCRVTNPETIKGKGESFIVQGLTPTNRNADAGQVALDFGVSPEAFSRARGHKWTTALRRALAGTFGAALALAMVGCGGESAQTARIETPPGIETPAQGGFLRVSAATDSDVIPSFQAAQAQRFDVKAPAGPGDVTFTISVRATPDSTPSTFEGNYLPRSVYTDPETQLSANIALPALEAASRDGAVLAIATPYVFQGGMNNFRVVVKDRERGVLIEIDQPGISVDSLASLLLSRSHVVLAYKSGIVRTVEISTGKVEDVENHQPIAAAFFSQDGRRLYTRANVEGGSRGPDPIAPIEVLGLYEPRHEFMRTMINEPYNPWAETAVQELKLSDRTVKISRIAAAPNYLKIVVTDVSGSSKPIYLASGNQASIPSHSMFVSVNAGLTELTAKTAFETKRLDLIAGTPSPMLAAPWSEYDPITGRIIDHEGSPQGTIDYIGMPSVSPTVPETITVPNVGSVEFSAASTNTLRGAIRDTAGNSVGSPIEFPAGSVIGVYSSGGRTVLGILVGPGFGELRQYNLSDGQRLYTYSPMRSLVNSEDGRIKVYGGVDPMNKAVLVVNRDGRIIKFVGVGGQYLEGFTHASGVLSPDGAYLIFGSYYFGQGNGHWQLQGVCLDGSGQDWRADTEPNITGYDTFSGDVVTVTNADGRTQQFNWRTGTLIPPVVEPEPVKLPPGSILSPDGQKYLHMELDPLGGTKLTIGDARTGEAIRTVGLSGRRNEAQEGLSHDNALFTQDGRFYVTASNQAGRTSDNKLTTYRVIHVVGLDGSVEDRDITLKPFTFDEKWAYTVVGEVLEIRSAGVLVQRFNIMTGQEIVVEPEPVKLPPGSILSPDGQKYLHMGLDPLGGTRLTIGDARTGEAIRTVGLSGRRNEAQEGLSHDNALFTQDGRFYVTASNQAGRTSDNKLTTYRVIHVVGLDGSVEDRDITLKPFTFDEKWAYTVVGEVLEIRSAGVLVQRFNIMTGQEVTAPPVVLPQPISLPNVGSVTFEPATTGSVQATIRNTDGVAIGQPILLPVGSRVGISQKSFEKIKFIGILSPDRGTLRQFRITGTGYNELDTYRSLRTDVKSSDGKVEILIGSDALDNRVAISVKNDDPTFMTYAETSGDPSLGFVAPHPNGILSPDGKFYLFQSGARPQVGLPITTFLHVFSADGASRSLALRLNDPRDNSTAVDVLSFNEIEGDLVRVSLRNRSTGNLETRVFNLLTGEKIVAPPVVLPQPITIPNVGSVTFEPATTGSVQAIVKGLDGTAVGDPIVLRLFGDGPLRAELVPGTTDKIRVLGSGGTEYQILDLSSRTTVVPGLANGSLTLYSTDQVAFTISKTPSPRVVSQHIIRMLERGAGQTWQDYYIDDGSLGYTFSFDFQGYRVTTISLTAVEVRKRISVVQLYDKVTGKFIAQRVVRPFTSGQYSPDGIVINAPSSWNTGSLNVLLGGFAEWSGPRGAGGWYYHSSVNTDMPFNQIFPDVVLPAIVPTASAVAPMPTTTLNAVPAGGISTPGVTTTIENMDTGKPPATTFAVGSLLTLLAGKGVDAGAIDAMPDVNAPPAEKELAKILVNEPIGNALREAEGGNKNLLPKALQTGMPTNVILDLRFIVNTSKNEKDPDAADMISRALEFKLLVELMKRKAGNQVKFHILSPYTDSKTNVLLEKLGLAPREYSIFTEMEIADVVEVLKTEAEKRQGGTLSDAEIKEMEKHMLFLITSAYEERYDVATHKGKNYNVLVGKEDAPLDKVVFNGLVYVNALLTTNDPAQFLPLLRKWYADNGMPIADLDLPQAGPAGIFVVPGDTASAQARRAYLENTQKYGFQMAGYGA